MLRVSPPLLAPPSASPGAAYSFDLSLAPLPALSQLSPQVSSCFNDSSTAIRQNPTQLRDTAAALGGTKGGRVHLCSVWSVFANIQGLWPSVVCLGSFHFCCHYCVDRAAISVPSLHHIFCVPSPSCTGQTGPRSVPELWAQAAHTLP